MGQSATIAPSYVIKAGELTALNYLVRSHPRPRQAEWINRGTDQKLRPTTVDLLLRTFFEEPVSASVTRIRETTGLRLGFRSDKERNQFASDFTTARALEASRDRGLVIALFDDRKTAERAVADLTRSGVPKDAVSLLWRAGQFMATERKWPEGHSVFDVAKVVAGGGVASALLGAGLLTIPGIGSLAALGAVAAASGTIGATGAAIAKMLTDLDVDDIASDFFKQQVRSGKVFVSVDMQLAACGCELVRDRLRHCGGHLDNRGKEAPVTLAA